MFTVIEFLRNDFAVTSFASKEDAENSYYNCNGLDRGRSIDNYQVMLIDGDIIKKTYSNMPSECLQELESTS